MKYLRTYEQKIYRPQIGDYVVCKIIIDIDIINVDIKNLLESNVGVITKDEKVTHRSFFVKYDNIEEYDYEGYWYDISEILFHSKNKSDCEAYIDSKKYNL